MVSSDQVGRNFPAGVENYISINMSKGDGQVGGRAVLSWALLMIFVGSLAGASPVQAQPNFFTESSEQVFEDVAHNHWACKSICRMWAKGVLEGRGVNIYAPAEKVTQEEVIVMLTRVLNIPLSKNTGLPANIDNAESVSSWAVPAVAAAAEKGIIAANDFIEFEPRSPAQRYQVAVFAGRAMGLQERAEELETAELDYTDTYNIPSEAWGYVALVKEKGIMQGKPDGTFGPLEPVTRAQVAVILDNVDAKMKKLEENTMKGEVFSLSPSTHSLLVTDISGKVISVSVAVPAAVFKGSSAVSYDDLIFEDKVYIIKNEKGEAAYIEVIPDEEFSELRDVEGTLKGIDDGDEIKVTVETESGEENTFILNEETSVFLDYRKASVDELYPGQEVRLDLRGDRVLNLWVTSFEQELEGEVTGTSYVPKMNITVIVGEEEKNYFIKEDARIYKDGDRVTLREIYPGDKVELEIVNGLVERIYAKGTEGEVEGYLRSITLSDQNEITIELAGGEQRVYVLASDASIKRQGRKTDITSLKVGDWVEAELTGNRVTELEVTARRVQNYIIGTVEDLNYTAEVVIIREFESKELCQAYLTRYCDIIKFGDEIDIDDLNEGDEIIAVGKIENGVFMTSTVVVVGSLEE